MSPVVADAEVREPHAEPVVGAELAGDVSPDLNATELFGGPWLKQKSEGVLYRRRTAPPHGDQGRRRGDAGLMHQTPEYSGALFQVASQTNCLEMVGPGITPEHGVTGYQHDQTQGPACAVAAGAATIYRNYFAPVGDQRGQTAARQLDGLADLGAALSAALDCSLRDLWTTRNGYALAWT